MLGQPSGLAPIAQQQLAGWQAIADGWPVSRDAGTPAHRDTWRCGDCGKFIAPAQDIAKREYRYSEDEFRAFIVLHLRNSHPDLDPN